MKYIPTAIKTSAAKDAPGFWPVENISDAEFYDRIIHNNDTGRYKRNSNESSEESLFSSFLNWDD